MRLTSSSFTADSPIPDAYAFCTPDPETHAALSTNRSPQLAWSHAPEGTRSFALVCIDPDAPTVATDVNQEGRRVPADLPRADFHHWAMVDIPASCSELPAGSCSDGVTAGGKQDPPGPAGARQGVNDYTSWFAGDADMGGTYHGYDGPAPPWNDERIHHYRFQLFALDIERCDVGEGFSAPHVLASVQGHVLAEATLTGTYTMDPGLRNG